MTIAILTLKQSAKQIKLISAAGKKLDERIHEVAVSGLAHFLGIDGDGNQINEGGDLTALTELVHAMPRSARGNALKYWITKHIPVKWDSKAYKGKGGWKKNGTFEGDAFEVLQAAHAEPFYMKEDKEAAVFNADKYIATIYSRISKEAKDGNVSVSEFLTKLNEKLGVAA